MSIRAKLSLALVLAMSSVAVGYIHFPPMTLQKMCKDSHNIRVLKVEKFNKEKGGIIFENAETIKNKNPQITSFKHFIRPDAEGVKPILDWLEKDKVAVMFSLEAVNNQMGMGYVFLDKMCYSVDYNHAGKSWTLVRVETGMSACYHGSVEDLRKLIAEILDGKEVKVPVMEPEKKEDKESRREEVNKALEANRRKKTE